MPLKYRMLRAIILYYFFSSRRGKKCVCCCRKLHRIYKRKIKIPRFSQTARRKFSGMVHALVSFPAG